MVIVHVYEMMCDVNYYETMPDSPLRNVIEFLGGPLVAPVFMVAMGIGIDMIGISATWDRVRTIRKR